MNDGKKNKDEYRKDMEEIAQWCEVLNITIEDFFSMSENKLRARIQELISLSNKSEKNSQNNKKKLNTNSRSTKDGSDSLVSDLNNVDGQNFGNKNQVYLNKSKASVQCNCNECMNKALGKNSLTENIQNEKRVRPGENDKIYSKRSGRRFYYDLSDRQKAETRIVGGVDKIGKSDKEKDSTNGLLSTEKLYESLEKKQNEVEKILQQIEFRKINSVPMKKTSNYDYPTPANVENLNPIQPPINAPPIFQPPPIKLKTYYNYPTIQPSRQEATTLAPGPYSRRFSQWAFPTGKKNNAECSFCPRKQTYDFNPTRFFQPLPRNFNTYYDYLTPANVENLNSIQPPINAPPIFQPPPIKLKNYNYPTIQPSHQEATTLAPNTYSRRFSQWAFPTGKNNAEYAFRPRKQTYDFNPTCAPQPDILFSENLLDERLKGGSSIQLGKNHSFYIRPRIVNDNIRRYNSDSEFYTKNYKKYYPNAYIIQPLYESKPLRARIRKVKQDTHNINKQPWYI